MGKLGGILIAAAIGLSACAAPVVTPEPATSQPMRITKAGGPIDISSIKVNNAELPEFASATKKIKGYEHLTPEALSSIARELCEHYAGGFTTEDLRETNANLFNEASGDALAKVGEAAKATVCAD